MVLPASAGDTRPIPGPGRFHMPWATKSMRHDYQSLCTLKPMLCNGSHYNEKSMHHNWRAGPTHCNRGKLRAATKTQHSRK